MNPLYLDLILVGFAIFILVSGWRRGLFVSIFSLLGLIFGAWIGRSVIDIVNGASTTTSLTRTALSAATLFIGIGVGSAVGGFIGSRLRNVFSWSPLRLLDNLTGAALSLVAWSIVFWLLATTLLAAPVSSFTNTVSQSKVLNALEQYMPIQIRDGVESVRIYVSDSGLPEGFANVAGISGYSFPIRINDPFFTRTGSCWGWATYKKVWQGFIKQKNELHVDFIPPEEKQLFNVYDKLYETMFIQNKQAMIQSWAVDFYLYYFLNKLYFLMPGKNLVNNIGFDGSGAHKKNGNFLTNNNLISNILPIELPNIIEEKPLVRKKIIQLYRHGLTKPTKLKRILNKFKRLLKLK